MKWKDLSISDRALLIKLGVLSGIRDIKLIRELYDSLEDTPIATLSDNTNLLPLLGLNRVQQDYGLSEELISAGDTLLKQIEDSITKEQLNAEQPSLFRRIVLNIPSRPMPAMIDSSKVKEDLSQRYDDIRKRVLSYKKYRAYGGYTDGPPFLQRILNNDNRSVVNWENNKQKATHKLSYAQTPEGYIVYPEVQEINGVLHDFTDPKYKHGKWDALDNAIKNNDTLRFSNELDALKYTQEYKLKYPEYFKQFDKGGYLSNTTIGHKVKKYKDGGPLKKKKENSLEYRLALFNNVDPRESYPSLITAIEYYLNVVDKMKKGDTSKNWKTDGSIGDATAEAAWAKYLNLPYNTNLLPIWNGDTVRLTKELENQIPIDTNFIKQDIENIKMNRDYDRSMGIFDREDAYRMALNTRRLTLDNLRKTYKTGKWVQMNEFMFNDLDPFDYYDQGSDYKTPLNVLLNFGLRYDKNTNSIIYGDKYDLNKYDYFLPGNPFIIRGSIPLEQKYNGGYISNTKLFLHKFDGGGYDNYDEPSVTIGYPELYYMGLLPEVEIVANKDLNKKELYLADLEWRDYLTTHPIQIGSELYNRLPNKAKAQIHKNRVTDAIDKAALPTVIAIIAPTALTAGAASLVGSSALTAAAAAAGKVGTKIAGTNLGKAAGAFINNPYVNLGLTGLSSYYIPQHFKNGVVNINTGNYIGALGDFGMIGLETLGATNTGKLLTNSVKGMVKPLFMDPYSPNTLTRVIGTGTSGLDDAVNSGIIRGNPNGGIHTAKKLHRQLKILKEKEVPKKTIDNYLSNNLTEKDYKILKKYMPEWFSDTETVIQVNGKPFSLGKKGLPTTYEGYIKEFRSNNPLFKNKPNFNPQTEREVLLNWEGVPEPTFALSPDLSKKYGFETENVLNSNLFKGDYAILIKNAETHGTPLTLAGHLPEHWSLKYPMEYNHPDVTFYKRFGIPFINKNIYYKIDPLKYTTIPLNKNGGYILPTEVFSHKF